MKIVCAVPLYNHAATVMKVAAGCRRYLDDVFIVDDGSTDLPADFDAACARIGVDVIHHNGNLGKGMALLTAFAEARRRDAVYCIAIDADGQHRPEDLPHFINALETEGRNGDVLAVGVRDFHTENVPKSSRFGRNFSNFWINLETGETCHDSQSGYRAYPVKALEPLKFLSTRYTFEIEVLVRGIWGGLRLLEIPVTVYYAPPGQRISHFRGFMDNFRLSMLHTHLVAWRLSLFPARHLVTHPEQEHFSLWRSPKKFFMALLRENNSPLMLAVAAGTGAFLAVLPLPYIHTAVILYVCCRLRLNKVMALAVQNLFVFPLGPFICAELGYYLQYGQWLHEISIGMCLSDMMYLLYEWFLGSLIVAPLAGVIVGMVVWGIAQAVQGCRRSGGQEA